MLEHPQLKTQERREHTTSPISFEEYLRQYSSVEGIQSEWLGGEVAVYLVTNSVNHQRLIFFLSMLLDTFLNLKPLGQLVLTGIPMKHSDKHPAREPDLMVVLNPHLERIKSTFVAGIADIVIEVVSPESEERDRTAKFREYEAADVPEYWLFDPLRTEADIYVLGEDRRYHRAARDSAGRLISSLLPGFALDTVLLWQTPLPTAPEIVALVQAMVT